MSPCYGCITYIAAGDHDFWMVSRWPAPSLCSHCRDNGKPVRSAPIHDQLARAWRQWSWRDLIGRSLMLPGSLRRCSEVFRNRGVNGFAPAVAARTVLDPNQS